MKDVPKRETALFNERDRLYVQLEKSLPYMKYDKTHGELKQFIELYHEMRARERDIKKGDNITEQILSLAMRHWHDIAEDLWLNKILDVLNTVSPHACWFGKRLNANTNVNEYGWWELSSPNGGYPSISDVGRAERV